MSIQSRVSTLAQRYLYFWYSQTFFLFILFLFYQLLWTQVCPEGTGMNRTHRSQARCHPYPIPQPVKVGHTTGVYVPHSFRSVKVLWDGTLAEANLPRGTTNQKYYPDLGSDTSSVWNFCAHFSDAVSRGSQWWPRETSAIFSSYEIQNWNLLNESFYSYPVHTLCQMLTQRTFFPVTDAV